MQFENTVLLFLSLTSPFQSRIYILLANEEYFYNNQKYAMFLILSAVLAL